MLTLEEFRQHLKTAKHSDCWVLYSPYSNKFKLSFDGRREVHFINEKGTLFTVCGRISKGYTPIARLVQNWVAPMERKARIGAGEEK
jgi:hypothetical protein